MLIFLGILAVFLGIAFYAVFIEPRRLKAKHYLIRKNKARVLDISNAYDLFTADSDVVIAHLSDFHFSHWYKPKRINKIIRSIMENQPDLIVFTGDLLDDYKHWPVKQTNRLIEKLKKLHAPMGKIAVLGNHDYKSDGKHFVLEILHEAGFTVLTNESVFGSDAQVSMTIAGIEDPSSGQARYNYESTLAEWHILLVHQPDSIQHVKNLAIYDLVLAGHSHGGQIRLPFYQVKNAGATRYTHSLYLPTKQTILSVSTGIGTTMLPARFRVPPEILYYHLSNKTEAFSTDFTDIKNKIKQKTNLSPINPTPPQDTEKKENPPEAVAKQSGKIVSLAPYRRIKKEQLEREVL